jgi:hypothetical protein
MELDQLPKLGLGRLIDPMRSVATSGMLDGNPPLRLLFPAPRQLVDRPPKERRTAVSPRGAVAEKGSDILRARSLVDPNGQPL